MRSRQCGAAADAAPEFSEKAFFEYHLYTLSQPTTLPENSTKQIELFPRAGNVDCDKFMVYDGLGPGFGFYGGLNTEQSFGAQSNKKVDVYLAFKNSKQNNMGMPLPKGACACPNWTMPTRPWNSSAKTSSTTPHAMKTSASNSAKRSTWSASAAKSIIKSTAKRKVIEEEIEIKVRNQKDKRPKCSSPNICYRWSNWEITSKSHKFDKKDAHTIHFPLRLAKGQEGVVRYRVRYTW